MGTILLIDGNSLTYRAFFALPTDMATASGQVTNAVFGFTSMLINLIKDHHPDGMVVAFDRPEPTFRHVAHPDVQGAARGGPRHPPPADGAGARGGCRARDQIRRSARVSRPTTSSPRCASRRRPATTASSSSPATATPTSWWRTRSSRCSTTAEACPTTRSTTRPASSGAPASRRRSTPSTPRCGATRATTCPACRASARRRRPS